jgi:hypothetical protein
MSPSELNSYLVKEKLLYIQIIVLLNINIEISEEQNCVSK